jgi:cytochrome c oxidase cbb3-type subunit 3
MSDFVSGFWGWYVGITVVASVIGCLLLMKSQDVPTDEGKELDHRWDETLVEIDNPLPKWWKGLFYATIVFAFGYFALYPGLGSYAGILGWTSVGQHGQELKQAEERFGPVLAKYEAMPIEAVARDPEAREMGKHMWLTYCTQCHGPDSGGNPGFPNLRDTDWIWGGSPEKIKETITLGRQALMPAYGGQEAVIGGPKGAIEMSHYVMSLSGLPHDAALAAKAAPKFLQVCAACHGVEGKGNQLIGSANLTDRYWLYAKGADNQAVQESIVETLVKGRGGEMPAQLEHLGPAKVHLLTGYVYGLRSEGLAN